MTKLNEQLSTLKESIQELKDEYIKIIQENELLKRQQGNLVSEKAELVRKNEAAKDKVASILERIKNLEFI